MKMFHSTTEAASKSILENGFRDSTGSYLTAQLWPGVWISNKAVTIQEGAQADDAILKADIPESVIAEYEWVSESQQDWRYREWLVPAAVLNRYEWCLWDLDEHPEDAYDPVFNPETGKIESMVGSLPGQTPNRGAAHY